MKVFLSKGQNGGVYVRARLEGEGGAVGDISREVMPGQDLFGVPFETLLSLGEGEHDISPVYPAAGK